jgi:hypothetical protein
MFTFGIPLNWSNPIAPPSGVGHQLHLHMVTDTEPASSFYYYNIEFEVTRPDTEILFGNLQAEYR